MTKPGNECWASHPHLACQCGRDKHHDGVHAQPDDDDPT